MEAIEAFGHFALGKGPLPRDTDIATAAREFEGLLLGNLQQSSAKPLFGEHPLDGGSAGRMYREMWLQELSRLTTVGGGLGLARMLGADETRGASE